MTAGFPTIYEALKSVLRPFEEQLRAQADSPGEYTLTSQTPSPFPQHKGKPMFFGSVRPGKAYVSFHLMPLYMNPALNQTISPALKKRMQGKACFNFKSDPAPEMLEELTRLTELGLRQWCEKKWL